MNKSKKWILGGIAFLVTACIITRQTQLLECASDSLTGIRYILILRGSKCKRGDIVLIHNHPTKYFKNLPYTKRVVGIPGDLLLKSKTTLRLIPKEGSTLHLESLSLPLLKATETGQPLTSLAAQSVPQGYVFAAGDHPRSFDSRYEEFGLVPVEKIWGRAVWVW